MRATYSLLLYLLLPVVLLRLWLRGRREPDYRGHWRERLGRDLPPVSGAIWLHAVSVGEVRAAQPLVSALRARYPDTPLLVTVTTPGGRETVRQLFGDSVHCRYLPYDLPGAVQRFLSTLRPAMALFMETELWPNLYAGVAARATPLYLVNARLSEKSLRRYRRVGGLMRNTLGCTTRVLAQSEGDRLRFMRLGVEVERIAVVGNLKFAAQLPDDWQSRARALRARLVDRHPVWVAASTHDGEEAQIMRAHARVLDAFPQALLLLAPRHPARAAGLLRECVAAGLSACLFSESSIAATATVVIVDRIGSLIDCYAAADVAFVGGSLVDCGGHNPIEAVLAGVPVVSGPRVANFADIYERMAGAGAVCVVDDSQALSRCLLEHFRDPQARARAVRNAREVVDENRDVLSRVLAWLDETGAAKLR